MTNFYITTTLPYVNAKPHLGFAWEILTADIIARYHRAKGETVIFNTGTDEHGQKIYQKASEQKISPQAYTDELVQTFEVLQSQLDLSVTNFIRTTDRHHQLAAQEFWRRCNSNGDIYKKQYQVKYCVGCELEKTESELVDGKCPLHPNLELELIKEENYFFRFSKYQDQLLKLYEEKPDFVLGLGKRQEIVSFVKGGLKDFSVSRLKTKMPWGIDVPGDETQVMYVWFDALVNYISTLGWPTNLDNFEAFWPGIQICGKDNLRQQTAMWQAMLLSAGLPTSKQILVNGFITHDGQKMSKSLGNVIEPETLIAKYGQQATRFLIASLPVLSGDVDITQVRLKDDYHAKLTNGLGNLCSRVAKLASTIEEADWQISKPTSFSDDFAQAMENYLIHQAVQTIEQKISQADQSLSQEKPWLINDQEIKKQILMPVIKQILQIAYDLKIVMPTVSEQILTHFTKKQIEALTPMFPRVTV